MKELIEDFTGQIEQGIQIFNTRPPKALTGQFSNVVISGLGGSGIGGTIIKDLSTPFSAVPVTVNKEYSIPAFVGANTLFIASSYSGDTEETLAATEEAIRRKATVICITSGGKLRQMAEASGLDSIIIPGGNPPRACLGYSLTQLICIFSSAGFLPAGHKDLLAAAIPSIRAKSSEIHEKALEIAKKVHGKEIIIYTDAAHEGIAIRFRQQLNENSKMLCWHHVVPEMNHNELVGWTQPANNHAVIFLRNHSDHPRNQHRFEINKEIIRKYDPVMLELWDEGKNEIESTLYTIHLCDWISYYLSELNQVDIMDIKVIDYLKSKLSDIS